MRRLLSLFGLIILIAWTLSSVNAAPGRNNDNAKACQKGGWQTLVQANGLTFASEQACVSFAAAGGTLTIRPTAIPPTAIPPTDVPPTAIPPTDVPPTAIPPTDVPPTATTEPSPTPIPPTPTNTPVPPTPTHVPPTATTVPPTQSLVITNVNGNCFVTASVAGYPAGTLVPVAVATWQFTEFVGWRNILYEYYTFTVRSDGTGSFNLISSNEAGRTDVATDIYVDGVKVHDFAPLAC
jgi:hypothetical protein